MLFIDTTFGYLRCGARNHDSRFLAFRISVLLAVVVAVLPVLAATTGSVRGVVRDSAGAAIVGVQVIATNTSMGIKSKATTDKKGAYAFPNLATGPYEIRAEASGYKPQTRAIFMHVDAALQIDWTLEPAEKSLRTAVGANR